MDGHGLDVGRVASFLRTLCTDLSSMVECTAVIPRDTLEAFESGLELVYRELLAYEMIAGDNVTRQQSEAIDYVGAAVRVVRGVAETVCWRAEPPETSVSQRGRPRLMVARGQLESLIEANFTTPQIAHMLGVSVSTVRRRMDVHGLSIRATYATLSEDELDQLIRDVSSQFPTCGSKQMAGHLLSRGFRVQQSRIREAQRRVDPQGVIMRQLTVMRRRQYSVQAPLSLYHIDGNHKLIR